MLAQRIYLAKDRLTIIILVSGGTLGRRQTARGVKPERKVKMALTRGFKKTVAARVQTILRNLINVTAGFEAQVEEFISLPQACIGCCRSRAT
jgi:hypothetical protein